ncbi:MAG: AAA family ATPase [Flavobacteriaceae bacterium]|nr:AAA family ATPase [Flavobacteriaceae bacterium]
MKIKNLQIQNWRSIVDLRVSFNKLVILIGQNNHGKSNVLSAIRFFFGEIKSEDRDFHNISNKLWVEIEFENLADEEVQTFKKYVTTSNTIKVRKTANKGGSFSYHGYIEEPKDIYLKEENLSEYTKRDKAKNLPFYNLLPESGRITRSDLTQALGNYILENRESLSFEYRLEKTDFLGAKNVAQGIFGDLFFIPSIKRASDELSTKGDSMFSQLYTRIINKMSESEQKYIEAKRKIIELAKIFNKTSDDGKPNINRPSDLTSLEIQLGKELESWRAKIDVQITPPNLDYIFKVGTSVLVDDGIKTDIERKGQGLQRALIFALLKVWSKILKDDKNNEENSSQRQTQSHTIGGRIASKSAYFIFEEPELFLHPQAQKEFFSSLVDLSNNEQIILTTHSSSFLDLRYHKSICIVKKDSVAVGTKIFQYTKDLFTSEKEKNEFNLSYYINPDRSELFFAEKVILCEGQTEKTIIPLLAKKLSVFRYDFTLIDCGCKDMIPLYIHLLNKFQIRYIVVYDKDHQKEKSEHSIKISNKSSKSIKDTVDSTYGKTIVLVNDIEEELKISEGTKKNKPYNAIKHVENDSFEITNQLEQKIKSIYES